MKAASLMMALFLTLAWLGSWYSLVANVGGLALVWLVLAVLNGVLAIEAWAEAVRAWARPGRELE